MVSPFGRQWSWGSPWGSEDTTAEESASPRQGGALLQQLLPLAAETVAAVQDPYQQALVWRQRAQFWRRLGFETKARVLEAKADAAERRLGLRLESEASTREWRYLGKTGLTVGIGVGVALILLLLASTARVLRRR